MGSGAERREEMGLGAGAGGEAQAGGEKASPPQSGLRELVNRAEAGAWKLPADGWYQLAPLGEYAQAEAGVVQVIDAEAVRRMAARGEEGPANILVDYDHFSYSLAGSSEAAGWIVGLEGREDGLWGQIRWTPEGEAAVRNGRYRYLSPAWRVEDCEECGVGSGEWERTEGTEGTEGTAGAGGRRLGVSSWRRVRPVRVHSVGLTNCPNLRGITALSNRRSEAAAAERKGMSGVMSELGLAAEASEESALAAVQALRNRAASAERRAEELAKRNALLLEGQVEADLERHKGRYRPEAREKWKAALLANREGALELLEGVSECGARSAGGCAAATGPLTLPCPPMGERAAECGARSAGGCAAATGPLTLPCPPMGERAAECGVGSAECGVRSGRPLHNRAVAGHPELGGRSVAGGVMWRQKAEVVAYKNRHDCTFDRAWQAVKAERPELFEGRE